MDGLQAPHRSTQPLTTVIKLRIPVALQLQASYMNDEKTNAAINSKKFKGLGHFSDQLYERNLANSEMQHKEPIILGFCIL